MADTHNLARHDLLAPATDPVCGMTVDTARAAGRAAHDGRTYFFCSTHCLAAFKKDPGKYVHGAAVHAHSTSHDVPRASGGMQPAGEETAKDPICGMVVGKAGALAAGLTAERGGRAYYFCGPSCKRTFEDPERELKSMKTRVTIALTGVLALAILRACAFIALALWPPSSPGRLYPRCPGSPGACGCSSW